VNDDSTRGTESPGSALLRVELPLDEFLRSQDSALARQIRQLSERTAELDENYAAFNNVP
jgi:FXSXX-COOH protein